ncbi:hypothetical protein DPMN_047120 [Dreissena polymorpha]|uniref:Uncharacterized protein n=1 Tax=Dreissena polymorpha TaxID=45954 RepID=A0A9D4D945_DREPO|nr:hypothetical protein DPMN_047120 [Dreissena polymorpha]
MKEADVLFNLCNKEFKNANTELEKMEDKTVTAVEVAAAKRSIKQLLADVRK